MAAPAFAEQLAIYGPNRTVGRKVTRGEARSYCRRLAHGHYENFTVGSLLMPRRLRQHFYNIYAYCRWADDLADEVSPGEQSLRLLDWWQEQLLQCYAGAAAAEPVAGQHPVMVALRETICAFDIPREPFLDLLEAFRRDQRQNRYETRDDLLDYCRYSANPVGRLVLYLGRCHREETVGLADDVCTGLQLANFWQDVARDWDLGRIYLPQETLRRHAYTEDDFRNRRTSESFRRMLASETEYAAKRLRSGYRLAPLVGPELRLEIELFTRGGLAVLEAIRRQRYDVWSRRPTVSRASKLSLLLSSLWRRWTAHRSGAK